MTPSTVGELFSAWDGCRKEARVWDHLKGTLEKVRQLSKGGGEAVIIRMPDGRAVEDEVLIRVLADIDGAIEDLEQQARTIEAQNVG